jgi:hypothetical protein
MVDMVVNLHYGCKVAVMCNFMCMFVVVCVCGCVCLWLWLCVFVHLQGDVVLLLIPD